MPFIRCQMEWSKPVRVRAVHDLKQLILLIELHLGVAQDLDYFVGVALVYLGPIVHFDLLDIFLPLLLCRGLL